MNETLKDNLSRAAISISLIVLLGSLIGNYFVTKKNEAQTMAVDRSPLSAFRFIGMTENSDGVFIDVVSLDNGKKYENIFISSVCPEGKNKKPGLIMKLSTVKYLKPASGETFYLFDRSYDYLCTNKDMEEADTKLLKNIKEARDRYIKENSSQVNITPPNIDTIQEKKE